MRSFPELRPNLRDGLVALAVILMAGACAAATWFSGTDEGLQAVISVNGTETERIDLEALDGPMEKVLEANGYTLHLTMDKEGVVMAESDCPTQDCVHTGTITRSGQSIVCLPGRVIVMLEGSSDETGPDVVIG